MENIVIGIEGLVGAGKTTISKELLNEIPNSIILHGGNIYRAVVWTIMNSGINLEEMDIKTKDIDPFEVLKKHNLSVEIENRESVIYLNGKKVSEEDLQSESSSLGVSKMSKVANNENLYKFGKSIISGFKEKYNVILSSRDIVKMFPEVDYHFFITASLEERTRRKCIQYTKNEEKTDLENFKKSIRDNIEKRDKLQEEAGYYKIYDQTIVIDVTEDSSAKESAQKLMKYIKVPSMN